MVILENSLIVAAELFFISANYSQLRRLSKTRNRKGLSAINQTLNGAGNIAWISYFASRQLPVPVITNATMLLLTTTTLAYTLGNKRQFLRGILAIAVISPITSYIIISHASISGWVGVLYNVIASTPWVLHVVTTKKTSGIAERSLFLSYGAILSTLTYGLLIGGTPLIVGCVFGLTANTIVTIYYYRYRNVK